VVEAKRCPTWPRQGHGISVIEYNSNRNKYNTFSLLHMNDPRVKKVALPPWKSETDRYTWTGNHNEFFAHDGA
jgi:hypothetical protein